MKRIILMAVCMVLGLAVFPAWTVVAADTAGERSADAMIVAEANDIIKKDPDTQYLKIDVSSTDGNVVLGGIISDQDIRYFATPPAGKTVPAASSLDRIVEQRIVAKIREIKGVKSVKSLLKVEEYR